MNRSNNISKGHFIYIFQLIVGDKQIRSANEKNKKIKHLFHKKKYIQIFNNIN